jgi:cobalt/nickel transport system ATP-binding protein
MGSPALAVECEGLRFRYPDGSVGLDGVDLRVPTGERLALIGPNGAGKSTLMLHLNGLLHGEGKLLVLGMPVVGRNLASIRQQVGLVFQNPDDQLFMPTVFDEIAFGALNAGFAVEETRARVERAMAQAGVESLARKHPSNLSLGQRKRVAIASVLVTDNRVLVLDEPSASLDPAGRRSLIELLETIETTVIVATHDADLALRLCGRGVAMRRGKTVREGSVAEILADPETFDP